MHLNDIEHTRTRVRTPRTNGAVEKLNQIIQEEFYSIAFRKKLYTDLEELQNDLDEYIKSYNFERTNQGKRCQGRTPYETFSEGVLKYKSMVYDKKEDKKVLQ